MSADPFADLVARVADMHAQALDHEAQIRDLLEEREELLTEIRRLQRGNHPAGRALRTVDEAAWRDLQAALDARDAEHEGGEGL